jgi:hypothetical protein
VVSPRPTSLASGETWWLTEIWAKPARSQAPSTMALVDRVLPGVHQHHGDRIDAIGAGPGEFRLEGFKVRPADRLAVGHDAFVDLDDAFVELFGKDDLLGENIRPCLVGDAKRVAEAPGDDQQRAVALALKQRIGGDRGAHLDVPDAFRRDRRCPGRCRAGRGCPGWRRRDRLRGFPTEACAGAAMPSGARPTTSVKVPPRSIQKSQVSVMVCSFKRCGVAPGPAAGWPAGAGWTLSQWTMGSVCV